MAPFEVASPARAAGAAPWWRGASIPLLVLTLAFGLVPGGAAGFGSAAPPPGRGELLLAGFDRPRELARWRSRAPARLALTTAWSSSGPRAAAITFPRWLPGQEQWPAALFFLPLADLSAFDRLEMEVYNPQPTRQQLRLCLVDGTGRAVLEWTIPGRSALTVSEPLGQFSPVVDLTRIRQLELYATRPESTYTLYVDRIRLRRDTEQDAEALAAAAAALADSLERQSQALGSAVPAEMTAAALQVESVGYQAGRLAADLRSARAPAAATARADRQRLRRLQTEYLSARAVAPRLAGLAQAGANPDKDFALAVESPMRKVFLEGGRFESPLVRTARIAAAGNEHESFQAIVVPVQRQLEQVSWTLSPLRGESGGQVHGSVRVVGYVRTAQPSYPVPHAGWWPDPLLDFQTSVAAVPLGEVLPLWVTFYVPAGTAPGLYRGGLEVAAAGAQSQSLDIELRVRAFSLPARPGLRTALSLRPLDPALYPGQDEAAMTRRYEDWLLREYGLNPGSIYATAPPAWDAARLRELTALGLNAINLGYVNAPLEPELDLAAHWRRLAAQLDAAAAWLPVAEAAGVRDLCYIYCFDERPREQLEVVYQTAARIRARFPDIEVVTTARDPAFGLGRGDPGGPDPGGIRVVPVSDWVALTPEFDANAAAILAAREDGRNLWWYVCLAPRQPYANLFVEYEGIQPRLLLGAMAAKYRPEGFLYYAVNRWSAAARPIRSGPRTDWNPASFQHNNGDGSLLCPGPDGPLATIRLENLRDGMEDLAYYQLLRRLLRARGLPPAAADVPPELVTDLATYSHDPVVLSAERERLAALIEALGR
jgi:hypothetical protein